MPLPALLTDQPLVPVAAARLTPKPLAERLAVPALLLVAAAIQAAASVALAVAPDETTSTSAPLPRSVMLSVPAPIVKVSAPAPPVSVSLPTPPSSLFAAALPMIVSEPDPPIAFSKIVPREVAMLLVRPPIEENVSALRLIVCACE